MSILWEVSLFYNLSILQYSKNIPLIWGNYDLIQSVRLIYRNLLDCMVQQYLLAFSSVVLHGITLISDSFFN